MHKLSLQQIAWRLAQDLPEGAAIQLGPGLPMLVTRYIADHIALVHEPDTANVDIIVLGPCQVTEQGDLAGVSLSQDGSARSTELPPDFPTGKQQILVMMELFDENGICNLVPQCTGQTSGRKCVSRVYTDLAVFEFCDARLILRELVEGITLQVLQIETDLDFIVSPDLGLLEAPKLASLAGFR